MNEPVPFSPRRRVTPWVSSCALHVILLILAALLIRGRVRTRGLPGDGDRAVNVVLKTINANKQTTYLTDASEQVAEQQQSADSAASQLIEQTAATEPIRSQQSTLPQATSVSPNNNTLTAAGMTSELANELGGKPNYEKSLAAEQAAFRKLHAKGPSTQMSLFGGAPSTGRSFVFVIDRSSSMGSDGLGALEAAAKELYRAVGQLRDVHKFQIVAYHHKQVWFNRPGMVPATAQNKKKVLNFFGGLAAFGGTDHAQAIKIALRGKPDVIYLLTDGGPKEITTADLREIKKRAGGGTTIHCVQFGALSSPDEPDNFMQRLARTMRGNYQYIQMSSIK